MSSQAIESVLAYDPVTGVFCPLDLALWGSGQHVPRQLIGGQEVRLSVSQQFQGIGRLREAL